MEKLNSRNLIKTAQFHNSLQTSSIMEYLAVQGKRDCPDILCGLRVHHLMWAWADGSATPSNISTRMWTKAMGTQKPSACWCWHSKLWRGRGGCGTLGYYVSKQSRNCKETTNKQLSAWTNEICFVSLQQGQPSVIPLQLFSWLGPEVAWVTNHS